MEHEPIIEHREQLETWIEDDDPSQVEDFFLHREFPYKKLKGEEEVFAWLEGRAENKLGRKLMVKLSKEGLIVPMDDRLEEVAEEE